MLGQILSLVQNLVEQGGMEVRLENLLLRVVEELEVALVEPSTPLTLILIVEYFLKSAQLSYPCAFGDYEHEFGSIP
jgi:hypothetical protein